MSVAIENTAKLMLAGAYWGPNMRRCAVQTAVGLKHVIIINDVGSQHRFQSGSTVIDRVGEPQQIARFGNCVVASIIAFLNELGRLTKSALLGKTVLIRGHREKDDSAVISIGIATFDRNGAIAFERAIGIDLRTIKDRRCVNTNRLCFR